MSYLILKNPKVCPACHCKTLIPPRHFRECSNCTTMLFMHQIDFTAYEADGAVRNYWLYTSAEGWKHRDHVMEKRAIALTREFEIEKLPDDYGRQTTPEAVAARTGKMKIHVGKKGRTIMAETTNGVEVIQQPRS